MYPKSSNGHRKPAGQSGASRVDAKPMGVEKRGHSQGECVIWSELHGDMKRRNTGGVWGCSRTQTQLSCDLFLGLPYNIACYALLTSILAARAGLNKHSLAVHFGDAHVYANHLDQVEEQLGREVRSRPVLGMSNDVLKAADLRELTPDMFSIVLYNPHPALKGEVAV